MLNPDGSGDDNFRFIQADVVAAQVSEELSQGTALLTEDEYDNDPFVDCEDDEEMETNETVVDDDTEKLTTLYMY